MTNASANQVHGQATASGHEPLPPGRALLALIGVVVLLAGFVALASVLQVSALFAGSLFVFFWVGVERLAPSTFIPALVGAVGGIANASLLHADVAKALMIDPVMAGVAGLILLLFAVYMLLIQKIRVVFNQSYMLLLTVAAMPQLGDVNVFVSMLESIALAAVYFGVIFGLLQRLGARREIAAAANAVAADG